MIIHIFESSEWVRWLSFLIFYSFSWINSSSAVSLFYTRYQHSFHVLFGLEVKWTIWSNTLLSQLKHINLTDSFTVKISWALPSEFGGAYWIVNKFVCMFYDPPPPRQEKCWINYKRREIQCKSEKTLKMSSKISTTIAICKETCSPRIAKFFVVFVLVG